MTFRVITSRTDYELGALGNLIATYDDGALAQASELHHEFGVIDKLGARRYWIKDQLGSVRAVVRDGTVVEWNDYYAYGAVRDKWSLADGRWKYLGKELDNETNALDFGARLLSLDASVWMSVDPLIVKYPDYSPYTYAGNNPLRFVDLNGMDWYQYDDGKGNVRSTWQAGNAKTIEVDGLTYKNIGATFKASLGNITFSFDQNEIVEKETILLSEKDFEKQKGDRDCQTAAACMSDKTGKEYGAMGVFPYKEGIRMAKENGEEIKKTSDWGKGLAYINNLINEGIAPVVGVNHTPLEEKTNGVVNDGTTDHFVTIASRKIDLRTGDVSYRYWDPGSSNGNESRFYFTRNSDGFLTGPGYSDKKYTVSHVVISKQLTP